jgi:3-oxoadipate enol-lactonase
VPFVSVNNTRLFYRLEGCEERPLLVLSHSLGCDLGMWEPQMPELLEHLHVLRYDTRGHGASDVPNGDYSMEQLGCDALGMLDALGIAKFAFCGLSMGGAIGLWLATHAPDRLTALVLANTSPRFDASTLEARRRTVLDQGIAPIADAVLQRFFSPNTLAQSVHARSVRAVLLRTDPVGYAGCCAALRDYDLLQSLRAIRTPTLVIGGDRDASTPWAAHGEVLAREIADSRTLLLNATHLSNIECPQSFTTGVLEFLQAQTTR